MPRLRREGWGWLLWPRPSSLYPPPSSSGAAETHESTPHDLCRQDWDLYPRQGEQFFRFLVSRFSIVFCKFKFTFYVPRFSGRRRIPKFLLCGPMIPDWALESFHCSTVNPFMLHAKAAISSHLSSKMFVGLRLIQLLLCWSSGRSCWKPEKGMCSHCWIVFAAVKILISKQLRSILLTPNAFSMSW